MITIETILTLSVITWGCTSLLRGNLRTYQRIPICIITKINIITYVG